MFEPSLTIVVPAFNERDNLGRVVDELCGFARTTCLAFEVLIIDDGSTDGTAGVLPAAPELRVIAHDHNRGLTAALRTGFFGARMDFVTWVPADGQIPARELGKLLAGFRGEDLILSTYRHRPDGLRRALMSRTLRLLLWAATGLRDRLEGVYLFRRALLDELDLVARTSAGAIGFEIAAKARALGKSIGSVEIDCAPRLSGASKVANTRNVAATLAEIWRIRRSIRARGRTPT